MPDTAKRTARVPILGEDGRISDDYVPAAIGEGVESAEAAAKRAETAATDAEGSATAASQSATQASGSASAAGKSADQARESAEAAGGAVTQAQSAQQAAEAAKTGAETAQSAAAGSAQDAQQSATAAAQSAASVADKFISSAQATTLEPGSEATASVADQVLTLGIPRGDKGEKGDKGDKGDPGDVSAVTAAEGSDLSVSTDGGTVTIDDSVLRERIAELENASRNVVTGTSTGLVAHGEDAYAQKPREVRVKGKTWVNRWVNPNSSANGVTVTSNDDGSLTLSGTNTGPVGISSMTIDTVKPNTHYTVLVDKPIASSNSDISFAVVASGGVTDTGSNIHFGYSGRSSFSFTTKADISDVRYQFYIASHAGVGNSVSGTYRVMLVDGTEAPDCFTPPASITSAQPENLVTAGKNLINTDGASVLAENFGVRLPNVTLQPGTYVAKRPSGLTGNFAIYREGDVSAPVLAITEAGASFTLTSPIHGLDFRSSDAGQITLDNISQFQLELGSTATAYEPPTVTQTPLPEVELRSLPNGTCDELVIKADGTCEVERRTQLLDGEVVALDTPTTEPQSPVTLPALPAPTFNQYHDSSVPSDTSTEYVRDINIAFDNLAKQVSGTASAVAVREASTIEEE